MALEHIQNQVHPLGSVRVAVIGVGPLTYGLGQSDDNFLAGGCLGDSTDDPLDSVHPDLQLHTGQGHDLVDQGAVGGR